MAELDLNPVHALNTFRMTNLSLFAQDFPGVSTECLVSQETFLVNQAVDHITITTSYIKIRDTL